ncbi:hypothetical protein LFM09_01785 [Lentzea alba]|uniref:hypothetical protein n=1 Tax=Lentzea alba TaxID=2714351 RepID=UPI0039BF3DEF
MSSQGFSRRTVLRGALVAGGAVALGGLGRLPVASAAPGAWPALATFSHGYPAVVETGRGMVVFGIGPMGRIYHRWQQGGGWSGWVELSNVELKTRPIALANHNGAMSVFATTKQNSSLLHGWQPVAGSPTWSWTNLGGSLVEEPFPLLNTDNGMSVFGQSTGGGIVHWWQNGVGGGWSGPMAFPGGTRGRPWAVVGPSGAMAVFARAASGVGIVHRWQRFAGDNEWLPRDGWGAVPGNNAAIGDPTAVVGPTGAITVFAESPGGITFTWQLGAGGPWRESWDEWTEHRILGRPSVVVGPTGGMAFFAKRAGAEQDNWLLHRSQPAWGTGWSNWAKLAPVVTGEPSGIVGPDGTLSAFGRNFDGLMLRRWQDGPGGNWPHSETFPDELRVG